MSLPLGAIQHTLTISMTNYPLPPNDFYVPDCVVQAEAYARCSHLGIGAHQDDLEFMAFHGISSCYKQDDLWFGGVTCTNGGGSTRAGKYANTSDEAMQAVRISEQRKAAQIGQYSFICQLGHSSAQCKKRKDREALVKQLENILLKAQPEVLYTHNPADKHPTHVTICQATVEAVHRISPLSRPKKVYGCEVWRGLDWLADEDKIALDVSSYPALARKLNACFDSQIAGGKNYSDAVIGRRHANASFYKSHSVDGVDQIWYAMNLTEPCHDNSIDLKDFVLQKVKALQESIATSLG